jgi:hypothetical protein
MLVDRWLITHGGAVRPADRPDGLLERLKFVSALVADERQAGRAATGAPRLLWRDADGRVASREIDGELVIGRDATCDLRFPDPRLSRRHCRLTLLNGVVWIADLGSANGTTVNGRPLSVPEVLVDGDLVGAGAEGLAFVAFGLKEVPIR